MDNQSWYILIYETADADSQEHVASGLRSLGHMVVQTERDRGDRFVIVECEDTTPAIVLHELVMAMNENATLVGSHGRISNGRLLDITFGGPGQAVIA